MLLFSILANSILETNSLSSSGSKQKLLFLQAKNHLLFLEEYFNSIDTSDIETIKIEDDTFLIVAQKEKDQANFLLSVSSSEFQIRLTKRVLRLKP